MHGTRRPKEAIAGLQVEKCKKERELERCQEEIDLIVSKLEELDAQIEPVAQWLGKRFYSQAGTGTAKQQLREIIQQLSCLYPAAATPEARARTQGNAAISKWIGSGQPRGRAWRNPRRDQTDQQQTASGGGRKRGVA